MNSGCGGLKNVTTALGGKTVALVFEGRVHLRWSVTQMQKICYSSPLNEEPIRRKKAHIDTLFSKKQTSLSAEGVYKSVGSEDEINHHTDWNSEEDINFKRQKCNFPFCHWCYCRRLNFSTQTVATEMVKLLFCLPGKWIKQKFVSTEAIGHEDLFKSKFVTFTLQINPSQGKWWEILVEPGREGHSHL